MSCETSRNEQQTIRATPPTEAVIIVAYDPGWPKLFEIECGLLTERLSPSVVQIEHIGSSAVPGLAAKERIDILAGVSPLGDIEEYYDRLTSIDYILDSVWTHNSTTGQDIPHLEVPVGENAIRYTFLKRSPTNYNLHVVEYASQAWRDPIAFRNYLRTNLDAVQEYEQLKRLLAETAADTPEYTRGKSEFIADILRRARQNRSNDRDHVSLTTD
jgi:GrpB-like predicted nucleotidyltransferase (UPF0157 family)